MESFNISKIEVVFFENNIGIISFFTSSNDIIHNISSVLNRELRNPSCLYFDEKNLRILSFDSTLKNVEELKTKYINENSIIINFNEFIFSLISMSNGIKLEELKSGKSKYAKYITSIHTNIEKDLENKLLFAHAELQHETDVALNLLQISSNFNKSLYFQFSFGHILYFYSVIFLIFIRSYFTFLFGQFFK